MFRCIGVLALSLVLSWSPSVCAKDAAKKTEKKRLLVMDLKAVDVPKSTVQALGDLVTVRLSDAADLEVMSGADMRRLLELEAEKAQMGCDKESCLAEIAGAMGAELVVFGQVSKLGSRLLLTLHLYDADQARAIKRISVEGKGMDALYDRLTPKVYALIADVASVPSPPTPPQSPPQPPPPQLAPSQFPQSNTSPSAADPLVGLYQISNATLANGKHYSGVMEIASLGEGYQVSWKTTSGAYKGVGLKVGSPASGEYLVAAFGGGNVGVSVFEHQGKRKLQGRWTQLAAKGHLGTETVRGVGRKLAGNHVLIGTSPGVKGRYRGKLAISRRGKKQWTLKWKVGGPVTQGIALAAGPALGVGWSTSEVVGVAVYRINGDKLLGHWSIYKSPSVNTENLVRAQ